VALIVDQISLINRNNHAHCQGNILGSVLDHDMTFDLTSRLGFPTQPVRSPNARTPFFIWIPDANTGGMAGAAAMPASNQFRVESGDQFEGPAADRPATRRSLVIPQ
jgi:hypothetical protein